MGRASKLFPLAGRKASTASQSSATDLRVNQPQLSKAERLLGTAGLQEATRDHIPRRSSYRSLNPSLSELGEDVDYDDFSNPDHFGLDPLPLRLADLRNNHSPGAGSQRLSSSASYSRSAASTSSRRVKGSWSSSTLKSHYDAANVHPSISQQTSNSSVRDRALRRDMSPVFESAVHDRRRPSTASAASSAFENRDSMDRATALPDITRLHSKSSFIHQSGQSKTRTMNPRLSTHSLTASPRFPGAAPSSRPNTSNGTGSLRKAAGTAGRTLKVRLSVDAFPNSIKRFSRRQHTSALSEQKPSGISGRNAPKNWWDNFPVGVDTSDAESEHDPNLVTPTEHLFPPAARNTPSPCRSDLHYNSSDRINTVYSLRKMNSSHDIVSARSSTTLKSPRGNLSRSSRPNSKMISNNLHETSVLSTSSSEEEDSEPDIEDDDDFALTHGIRDSIAVSEIDVHHVGRAQALHVKSMRQTPEGVVSGRRPSIASLSSNTTNADSNSIKSAGNSPSYLSVPNRTPRSRKRGHSRQPSSIPEDNDIPSQVAPPISPPASMRSFSAPQSDGRKLMAVTEEEEALLELMRRKRADKAAQRDSGLTSIKSSSTRSHRPVSNLSGTSSILDSFPLSRSQRSSLLASRTTTQPTPEQASIVKDAERGRKRQSVATTATDNTYYSIDSRLESPTRLKYAFTPHLSLASLDVSLSGLPSLSLDGTATPSPEPLPSPTTPLTRQATADVFIRENGSKRNSTTSYVDGDRTHLNEELLHGKLQDKLKRKTTGTIAPSTSPDAKDLGKAKKSIESPASTTTSGDEEASRVGSEDNSSSGSVERASTVSKNTSDCSSTCAHYSCSAYQRRSLGHSSARCSVSEDVLAAWGSLGGWRDPGIMG
ncbi:uncharacterized protein PV09_06629 [Verruconis gallopava]|uniref:Uncharacterized protein n=1 Tax=Verruconis gallopava TaxID=253628 RepID=A0A0D2A5Y4_9PEZI|nr:uncharacterized protein PV09_06629 [Verruconis gallopava]KIW02143.1 hypothetical protein PV09_06629 [Verruconis gallopava]